MQMTIRVKQTTVGRAARLPEAPAPQPKPEAPQTWTKEGIRVLLESNDRAVCRALVALYERQTADEQASETTKHTNGVGFTAFDADLLSSFAVQVRAWEAGDRRYPQPLSPKQIGLARRRVVKYARQLAEIANTNTAAH